MVSEQETKACKIFRVIEMISTSRVFKATIRYRHGQVIQIRGCQDQKSLTLDGDDELRDNREDLSTTLLEHVKDTLDGEESVWVLLFTNTLEENRKVMMVVELLDLNFPVNSVLRTMLNGNREISTVVETTELTCRNGTIIESSSLGLLRCRLVLRLKETDCAATETLSLLQSC